MSSPSPLLWHLHGCALPATTVYYTALLVSSVVMFGAIVGASIHPADKNAPTKRDYQSAHPQQASASSFGHQRHPGSEWIGLGAYWNFHDSVFVAQGYLPTAKAYYSRRTFGDFTFEVRMAKLSEDGAIGLLFRYDEVRDQGYEIHFWPHGGFAVAKFIGPTKKDFASGPPSHFNRELNTWNVVRVQGRGERFDFSINGFHVKTVFDREYRRGRLGLLMPGDARQRAKFQVIVMSE